MIFTGENFMSHEEKNSKNQAQVTTLLIEAIQNQEKLSELGQEKLNKVIQYLKKNPDSIIKITGQSNNSQLAINLKAIVWENLSDNGIDLTRIVRATESIKQNKDSIKLEIMNGNVNMAYNGQDLTPRGKDEAKKIYDFWKGNKKNIISLTGGATRKGEQKLNKILALKRAQEIKKELLKYGVPPAKIAINASPNLNAKKASVNVEFYHDKTSLHSSGFEHLINIDTKQLLEKKGAGSRQFIKDVNNNLNAIVASNQSDQEKYNQEIKIRKNLEKQGFRVEPIKKIELPKVKI
jgi:outer membrane protein OmpA-like peptidoglycan-associated protein